MRQHNNNLSKIIPCILVLLFFSCQPASIIGDKISPDKIADGIFEGRYKYGFNEAVVEVTIQNQKIIKINLIQHKAWKGRKADDIIPERIISAQSTHVDAVSGATNSSRVIMNAVQMAIEKSIAYNKITAEYEQ